MTTNEGTFEAMDEVVDGFYAAADAFIEKVTEKAELA